MKRRAFFGFAAGAAVAGPGIVKEVAAKAAMDLSGGAAMLGGGIQSPPPSIAVGRQMPGLLQRAASATSFLRSLTRDQHAELKRRFGDVHRLDSDLASYHSMSMGARIDIQRDRNVEAFLTNRRTWWQGVLNRGDDDYSSDPLNNI